MKTLTALLVGGALSLAQTPAPRRENTLPMGQFKPVTTLHLPEHNIERAKFPVIDVHNHVNDAYDWGDPEDRQDPAKVVKLMDKLNIRKIVILTSAWGDKLQKVID